MAYVAPYSAAGTPVAMRGSSWAMGSARNSEVLQGSPRDLVPVAPQDAQRDPFLHRKIRKSFSGRWYYGEVIKIDADAHTGERFYHVVYEDFDEEHLSAPQVQTFLNHGSQLPTRQPRLSGPHTPAPTQSLAAGLAASVAASRRISFNTSGPTPRRGAGSAEGLQSHASSLPPSVPAHAMHQGAADFGNDAAGFGFGPWSVVVAVAVLAAVKTCSACWQCTLGSSPAGSLPDEPVLPSGYSWPEPHVQPSSWFVQPAPAPVTDTAAAPAPPLSLPSVSLDWVIQPLPLPPKPEPSTTTVAPLAFSFDEPAHHGVFEGLDDLALNWQEKLESNFSSDMTLFVGLAVFAISCFLFLTSIFVSDDADRPMLEDLSASPFHMPDALQASPGRPAPPTPAHGFDHPPSPAEMPASSLASLPAPFDDTFVASDPYVAPAEQSGAERLAALLGQTVLPEQAPPPMLDSAAPSPMPEPPATAREPLSVLPCNSQLQVTLDVGKQYTIRTQGANAIVRLMAVNGDTATVTPFEALYRKRGCPTFRMSKRDTMDVPCHTLQNGPFMMLTGGQAPHHIRAMFETAPERAPEPVMVDEENEVEFQPGIVNKLIQPGARFRHIAQLRRFRDMGFEDTPELRRVLDCHRGDFNLAMDEMTIGCRR